MIHIPERINKLTTYKAGKSIDELAREKGLTKIVKLASNENPLGPSPKAVQSVIDNVGSINRYGDPGAFEVVTALAQKYNKPFDSLFVASGSDAILQYIIMVLTDENDYLLSSQGSFIGWYVNANKLGRKSINIPLTTDYKLDLSSMAEHINDKIKLIYLANPNNPTGTYFTKRQFEDFLHKIPENIVVILDEAYTLYAEDKSDYPNGLDYDYPNLVVLRTMSKSYGMAGLRMGFAYGHPDLISAIKKGRMPFEPNTLASHAAIAALEDDEFLTLTGNLNKISLSMLRNALDKLGIKYTDSAANFLLMIFETSEKAKRFNRECLDRGLILRYVDSFGIPTGIRINSGTVEETEFAIDIMTQVDSLLN